jgi:predicted ATPase
MSKLENISIKGFRRLEHTELEMRDLIVMIGANGSGKTSFLDVLSILAASARGNLHDTLQIKGGLNEILTRGKARELEIKISMKVPEAQSQHNRSAPTANPESVNHQKPPAYRIKEIFRLGNCKRDYNKIIDGKAILKKNDLMLSIDACPELKAFVNTIISLCDLDQLIP